MSPPDNDHPRPARRRWLAPAAIALLVAAAGVSAAVGMGHGGGFAALHRHGHDAGDLSTPAGRAAHVGEVLQMVYAETGATAEQKLRLEPIVRKAADELIPMHQSLRAGHVLAHELLQADVVDRDALEALRQEQLQTADQASRRLVALAADVADVLTPAQRRRLLARIAQAHGAGGH